MKFAKMSTMATFIPRQYREVVGVALQLRGNRYALMAVSQFISQSLSLSDASAAAVTSPIFSGLSCGRCSGSA